MERRKKCRVLHVRSPDRIFIKVEGSPPAAQHELQRELDNILSDDVRDVAAGGVPADLEVGEMVAVVFLKRWVRRGIIRQVAVPPTEDGRQEEQEQQHQAPCHTVSVELYDEGEVKDLVAHPDLGILRLPEALKRYPRACLPIQLHGVVPTGSSDRSWSQTAAEEVKNIVRNHKEFWFEPKDEHLEVEEVAGLEYTKASGILFYNEVKTSPFTPPEEHLTDVAKALVDKGLALRVGRRGDQGSQPPDDEEGCCEAADPRGTLDPDREGDRSPDSTLDDSPSQSEGWPEPVLSTAGSSFRINITYLDHEGQVYGQVIGKDTAKLASIEAELTRAYEGVLSLDDPSDFKVGDVCVARYKEYGRSWHRALVVGGVSENRPPHQPEDEEPEIEVLYVDYGETKMVLPSLRECFRGCARAPHILQEPILCHRFIANMVMPIGGKYSVDFLDILHQRIVGAPAMVEIRRLNNLQEFPIPAILRVEDPRGSSKFNLNLTQYILDTGAGRQVRRQRYLLMDKSIRDRFDLEAHGVKLAAQYLDGRKLPHLRCPNSLIREYQRMVSLLRRFGPDPDVSPAGQSLLTFPVEIKSFLEEDVVMVRPTKMPSEFLGGPVSLSPALAKALEDNEKEFYSLTALLDDAPKKFSKLSHSQVEIGFKCSALLPSDGNWYRAMVIETGHGNDEDGRPAVRVELLDFGDTAVVEVDNHLRELPATMMVVAPQAFPVQLKSIGKWAKKGTMNSMLKRMHAFERPLAVELSADEDIISGDLVTVDGDGNKVLAYGLIFDARGAEGTSNEKSAGRADPALCEGTQKYIVGLV